MNRIFVRCVVAVLWVCPTLLVADEIQRGTLKKLDVPGKKVVVEIDGKQREFLLTDNTHVLDATGKDLAEKLRDFREGASIFVKPDTRDGRSVLLGIKLAEQRPANEPPRNNGVGTATT